MTYASVAIWMKYRPWLTAIWRVISRLETALLNTGQNCRLAFLILRNGRQIVVMIFSFLSDYGFSMERTKFYRSVRNILACVLVLSFLSACASAKYSAFEKIGIHKRDLLVGNVEDTRDAQKEAQEQFKDALEKFGSVVTIEETGLKKAYDRLSDEYEDSVDAAEEVSDNINDVQEVADDLFAEWKDEIGQYSNADLKRSSQQKLRETQGRYGEMLRSMREAERSMQPVLATFKDNVLFLKHNLNAQAVGSLRGTFRDLASDIDVLIEQMNRSIQRSDAFIADMKTS